MNSIFPIGIFVLAVASLSYAADLSPAKWPVAERERAEALEQQPWDHASRLVEAKSSLISATMSPIAIRAGIEALKQGGTAADAAATVALTQVTTALGSYVSYAGALQLVYYDAKTAKVYTMNAGWGSYQNETEPKTIPKGDNLDAGQGRKTFVPGFMAGIEAMHHRFGVLPFADLFEPAIWYSENGLNVSPLLAGYFASRQTFLSRTAEGKAFLRQAGNQLPVVRDRFVQIEVAKTLRAVAQHGAQIMYTGSWGQEFVAAVQREGGKVTLDDMKRYQPIWEEPLSTEFAGHTIYAPGRSTQGGFDSLQTLNLLENQKIDRLEPYWKNPQAFVGLSRALEFAQLNGYSPSFVADMARRKGINLPPQDRATKTYTDASLPLFDAHFAPPPAPPKSDHSDSIVVIDQWGNVAALVHTINTVLWGTTGIVVGGMPLSDAACFQQARLAGLKPGELVPSEMVPMIVMTDGKPSLAVAAVGAALLPETVRILLGTLGNHLDALQVMAAPPLFLNFDYTKRIYQVPEGAYDKNFLASVRAAGLTINTVPRREVGSKKGTAVIGLIDAATGTRRSVEVPRIISFADGY